MIPEGPLRDVLRPLFAEFDAHGLSGGNGLVLRAILGREPRSFRQFLGDLATQKQRQVSLGARGESRGLKGHHFSRAVERGKNEGF